MPENGTDHTNSLTEKTIEERMISFIIPIYNAEAYLRACVQSVLAQTVSDMEVLLIDDGSTDHSWLLAQEMASRDARVHAYRQVHAGQSVARNYGLGLSQGEFIAFLDADDALEPDWSERHLAAMDGVDYVQSGYKRILQDVVQCRKLPLHRYQFISPCMRLYRKTAIRHLSFKEGYIYEDVLFSVDLWLSGARSRLIRNTGYLYTLNPEGTTSRPHPEAQRKVFQVLREKAQAASLKNKLIIWYTIIRLHIHFILQ
jgi:glycosyltransferase involved in cell wall biosynthesis